MTTVGRYGATLSVPPAVFDAGLAVVAFSLTLLVRHPDSVAGYPTPVSATILAAVACLVLAVRRRWPLPTLGAALTLTALATAVADGRPLLATGVAIALYTVASRTDRRTAWAAWGTTAMILASAILVAPPEPVFESTLQSILSILTGTAVFAAVGDAVRSRRAYIEAVEERAKRAEKTREEETRRRVAEERLHIARELHDVVAHGIAVVSVQAGVASHLVFKQPQAAFDALQHIHQASTSILNDLGGILSVLRDPGAATEADAPAPGLRQLDALVASYAGTGLQVTWSLAGAPQQLTGVVDLVAYRVVQEALTNAHRHGTGTARLDVRFTPALVEIEVVNPLRSTAPVQHHGTGYGLIGLQERTAAVSGTLEAGVADPGHFRLSAALPVRSGQP